MMKLPSMLIVMMYCANIAIQMLFRMSSFVCFIMNHMGNNLQL